MLGSRTRDGRMEGADKSTELWWHPNPILLYRGKNHCAAFFHSDRFGFVRLLNNRFTALDVFELVTLEVSFSDCFNSICPVVLWRVVAAPTGLDKFEYLSQR